MPKPLREPPPSSSVARLLDKDAAARAVATPRPTVVPQAQATESVTVTFPAPATAPSGEPANLKREFVFSPSTDQTFTRLVDLYRRSTGTRLSSSHVLRAVLKGVAHSMDSLEREARRIGPLKLPGNARGREGERERFEEKIAEAFVAGIRAAPAFERD
jgi:hypothetical protein